jgi:hypothetical protein
MPRTIRTADPVSAAVVWDPKPRCTAVPEAVTEMVALSHAGEAPGVDLPECCCGRWREGHGGVR